MKKILLSSLALLAIAGTTMAQNRVYVPDFEISPNGDVVDMAINIELEAADYYTAFEANIELPEGFTYQFDGETTDIVYEEGDCLSDHGVSPNFSEGIAKVVVVSMNSKAFKGTSGTTAWLKVIPPADVEVGQTFTGTIKDIVLVPILGAKQKLDAQEFTITVGDGRLKFNESSSSLPKYTAGEKANVTMMRTIKAGQWSTIVLPFTLTKAKAEAAFGSDVQLAEFSGFDTEYTDENDVTPDAIKIHFTKFTMTAQKGMTGGKLFLIRTSGDVEQFTADDVKLAAAVTEVEKSDEFDVSGKFTGSLVKTVVPEDGLFISDNKFWYSVGKTNIKAFRGWFELGAVLDKETDFGAKKVTFDIDGDATRIEGLSRDGMEDGAVYTLGGQLVGKDVRIDQLPKGVYIINGKKRVVK